VSKNYHEFHVSQPEEKQLNLVLNVDSPGTVDKVSHQNILNFIRIEGENPDNIKTHPLNYGGFSFIESAEISFKFIDSFSSSIKDNSSNAPVIQRRVAIKRENRPHGKNLHEYRILT
jgi:hypothetical protein